MPLPMFASLVLGLGFMNGLRTLTPVAVLCWGAHLHVVSFAHTPFVFLASPVSLIVFTVLAAGELVADKLPKTPSRLAPPGLIGRSLFGGGVGAALAAVAGVSLWLGIVPGVAGALLGSFVGYGMRRTLTHRARLPDLGVALVEDLIAIGGSIFVISRF